MVLNCVASGNGLGNESDREVQGAERGTVVDVAQHRFDVPPEQALSTLAYASAAMSAPFAFDAHMDQHATWREQVSAALRGVPRDPDDRLKEARAKYNALAEQIRGLRRDLAELAADAEAVLPPDVSRANEIVREPQLDDLPSRVGPVEMLAVEKMFVTGLTGHMRAATRATPTTRPTTHVAG